MTHRVLTIIVAVAVGIVAWWPHTAAASTPMLDPTGRYYLALGDSLAFGFQQAKFNAQLQTTGTVNPAAFSTGYVNDLDQLLAPGRPGIQLVNYGCPGEASTSFISSPGCPTYPFPLHNAFSGSQLDAALAFLRAHPGEVGPITLDIGTNDVETLVEQCGGYTTGSLPCVFGALPGTLAQVSANLNQIVGALHRAAPSSQIVVMQYYNPIAIDSTLAIPSDAVVLALNGVIAQAAMAHGAQVADAFAPFNLGPQPQTLCSLTLMCSSPADIHPSDAGYQVIANQFRSALR